MKKVNLIFLPIFAVVTLIVRFQLLDPYKAAYFPLCMAVCLAFIGVRGEVLRKWIRDEYPEVAAARGGLTTPNMLNIVFILHADDGDRRLHRAKRGYMWLSFLAVLWTFGGVYLVFLL